MRIRFYHWWIYNLFRFTWGPLMESRPGMVRQMRDYMSGWLISKDLGKEPSTFALHPQPYTTEIEADWGNLANFGDSLIKLGTIMRDERVSIEALEQFSRSLGINLQVNLNKPSEQEGA